MSFVKRLVLLCTSVLCSGVITAAAADEARDFVVGLNIMSMAESGEFEGEKPVTRAQMAEILSAVYGISDEYFGGVPFTVQRKIWLMPLPPSPWILAN